MPDLPHEHAKRVGILLPGRFDQLFALFEALGGRPDILVAVVVEHVGIIGKVFEVGLAHADFYLCLEFVPLELSVFG